MGFLKWLMIILVSLVLILVLVGFLLPKKVAVQRATTIDAPPAVVFGLLTDFRKFNEWSPWAKLDPNTKYEYSGSESGVGAKMSWSSENRDVGSGTQEITAVEKNRMVQTHLDFGKDGKGDANFQIKPEGDGTHISWNFETDFGNNLIGRYIGLMFDGMLGPKYEEGLASLKTMAESMPVVNYSDLNHQMVDVESQIVAYKKIKTEMNVQAIQNGLGAAYGEVIGFIGQNGLQLAGPPMTINISADPEYVVDAAIPVDKVPDNYDEAGAVKVKKTYAGKALLIVHHGAYTQLADTYTKAMAYIEDQGFQMAGSHWDVYLSDPGNVPEDELITHIFFPISQ